MDRNALATQSRVSGRDAVAIIVRSVSWRASWTAIDPTPPAPPTIRMVFAAPMTSFFTLRRSNSASKAVIALVGSAAACA
ncbi:hypothetical protein X755_28820 [Mesorhizobium sp. LNJC405B00]|nr:hypothetical protein X755_28820 [Mesorhizobium sp. LNJC405B00]